MSGKAPPRGPRALVGPEMGSSPPSRPPPTGPRSLSSTNNNTKAVNGRHNPPCDADDSLAAGRQPIAFAFTSKPTFTPRAVASKTRENIPQPPQPPPPPYDPPPPPPPSEPPPPPPPSEPEPQPPPPPPPPETAPPPASPPPPPPPEPHSSPPPPLDPPPPLPQPQPIHIPYTIHMTKKHPALRTPTSTVFAPPPTSIPPPLPPPPIALPAPIALRRDPIPLPPRPVASAAPTSRLPPPPPPSLPPPPPSSLPPPPPPPPSLPPPSLPPPPPPSPPTPVVQLKVPELKVPEFKLPELKVHSAPAPDPPKPTAKPELKPQPADPPKPALTPIPAPPKPIIISTLPVWPPPRSAYPPGRAFRVLYDPAMWPDEGTGSASTSAGASAVASGSKNGVAANGVVAPGHGGIGGVGDCAYGYAWWDEVAAASTSTASPTTPTASSSKLADAPSSKLADSPITPSKPTPAPYSAPFWRRMIEHVRAHASAQERIRGKGKGREVLVRVEGEVVGPVSAGGAVFPSGESVAPMPNGNGDGSVASGNGNVNVNGVLGGAPNGVMHAVGVGGVALTHRVPNNHRIPAPQHDGPPAHRAPTARPRSAPCAQRPPAPPRAQPALQRAEGRVYAPVRPPSRAGPADERAAHGPAAAHAACVVEEAFEPIRHGREPAPPDGRRDGRDAGNCEREVCGVGGGEEMRREGRRRAHAARVHRRIIRIRLRVRRRREPAIVDTVWLEEEDIALRNAGQHPLEKAYFMFVENNPLLLGSYDLIRDRVFSRITFKAFVDKTPLTAHIDENSKIAKEIFLQITGALNKSVDEETFASWFEGVFGPVILAANTECLREVANEENRPSKKLKTETDEMAPGSYLPIYFILLYKTNSISELWNQIWQDSRAAATPAELAGQEPSFPPKRMSKLLKAATRRLRNVVSVLLRPANASRSPPPSTSVFGPRVPKPKPMPGTWPVSSSKRLFSASLAPSDQLRPHPTDELSRLPRRSTSGTYMLEYELAKFSSSREVATTPSTSCEFELKCYTVECVARAYCTCTAGAAAYPVPHPPRRPVPAPSSAADPETPNLP
ncbi:hypothetical protein C8J57DRAFT_1586852 [Mycena rebaudengoi]|nr:hypothetical protein C8J57DRAFT_1586852 [Mycena rebaudengoi]